MKDKGEYKKKDAFRVPENYFEDFTEKITSGISRENESRRTGLFKLIRPHLMLAASMAVIVIISFTLLTVVLPGMDKSQGAIEPADIESLLAYEMSEPELIEALEGRAQDEPLSDPLDEISDEDLIEYLINSGITDNEIIQNQ